MVEDDKKPPKSTPQGAFSGRSLRPTVPAPQQPIPAAARTSIPRGLLPVPPRPSDGPVLGEIDANEPVSAARDFDGGGHGVEGDTHDGWSKEGAGANSTLPPPRRGEVERLRELSAQRISELPLEIDGGGALDLVDHSRPSQELDLEGEMRDCYALDDLTGALRFADLLLGRDPQHGEARHIAEDCRVRLLSLYSSKVGDLERVVEVALDETELRWLGLDHRSGFLLSRVDGMATVDELLDVCGMPRLEALKTLSDLVERGAIRFR